MHLRAVSPVTIHILRSHPAVKFVLQQDCDQDLPFHYRSGKICPGVMLPIVLFKIQPLAHTIAIDQLCL